MSIATSFDLSGTVALVTGARGGIGAATVLALSEAGAKVIATDRDEQAEITGAALYLPLDVTREDAWTAVLDRIEQTYGRLDILVNNAGISLTTTIEKTTTAAFEKIMAVNVTGVFLGTKTARPLLARAGKERHGGASIINLSSVGGLRGAAYAAAYCASKGAVKLFTKSAAVEYAALGLPIRVNSVHPGAVDTDMMTSFYESFVSEGLYADVATAKANVAQGHALGRTATGEDIAAGIVYLASPAASFVTGSELVIDGGMTAR